MTKDTWPPTTAIELARVLHENDRTMGEATGDWQGKDWESLSEETQSHFRTKAEGLIASKAFCLGIGWNETHLG